MDRVRTLGEGGRKLDGRIRWVGQGKAASLAEARAAWRVWYNTARWRRLRDQVLLQAEFTCCYCGKVQSDSSQLVADHKVAHRGNARLFWDEGNLQCLCAPCHNRVKQSEEAVGS